MSRQGLADTAVQSLLKLIKGQKLLYMGMSPILSELFFVLCNALLNQYVGPNLRPG